MSLLGSPTGGPGSEQAPPAGALAEGLLPAPAATDQLIDQLLERVQVPAATGALPPSAFPLPAAPYAAPGGGLPQPTAFPYQLPGVGGPGGDNQLDPLVQELQQRRPGSSSLPAAAAPLPHGMLWPGALFHRGTLRPDPDNRVDCMGDEARSVS